MDTVLYWLIHQFVDEAFTLTGNREKRHTLELTSLAITKMCEWVKTDEAHRGLTIAHRKFLEAAADFLDELHSSDIGTKDYHGDH